MWDAGCYELCTYTARWSKSLKAAFLCTDFHSFTVLPAALAAAPHSHRLQSCPRDRTAAVEAPYKSGCRLSVSTVQCTQRALSCAGWRYFPQTLRLADLKYTKNNTAGYSFGGGLKRYRPRRPFVSIVQAQKRVICSCVTCWRKNKLKCDYST